MRKSGSLVRLLLVVIALGPLTGCFLQDSVTEGISEGIISGLSTVIEELIVGWSPPQG